MNENYSLPYSDWIVLTSYTLRDIVKKVQEKAREYPDREILFDLCDNGFRLWFLDPTKEQAPFSQTVYESERDTKNE